MVEVGLVPFARLALKIATAVLPRYRIVDSRPHGRSETIV
jgi:hypothetical protein